MSDLERLTRQTQGLIQLIRIAEHMSINKAATAMHVSQSALTRSLARLEEAIGFSLFERTVKGVRPTSAGEIVLQHARIIERQIKGMKTDLEAAIQPAPKLVRIGATPRVGSLYLLDALTRLQSRYPKLVIRHVESGRPDLLNALRLEELDVVLSTFPFEGAEPGLVQIPCFDLDMRVVARSSHPLARAGSHNLRQLTDCKWVLPPSDTDLHRRVQQDFQRAGAEFPQRTIETASPAAARHLMLASDMLAILPMRTVQADVDADRVVVLCGDWSFEHRTVGWFLRADANVPRELQFLMKALATG